MRILLKFEIDCDADAAWRALHSPAALGELYGPLVEMVSTDRRGMPTRLESGAMVPVALTAASLPLGRQLIRVEDRYTADSRGAVRILRDRGRPTGGPLALLTRWDHQMAVAPAPSDPAKTLWRDRLIIGGPVAPALWPALWAVWQWREARIRALAPTWAHDPEYDTPTP